MTARARTLFVLSLIGVVGGCVRLHNYAYVSPNQYPPKAEDAFIETFYQANVTVGEDDPEIPEDYEILARFSVAVPLAGGGSLEEKAHEKAREIGGDAVVVQTNPGGLWTSPGSQANVFVIRYR